MMHTAHAEGAGWAALADPLAAVIPAAVTHVTHCEKSAALAPQSAALAPQPEATGDLGRLDQPALVEGALAVTGAVVWAAPMYSEVTLAEAWPLLGADRGLLWSKRVFPCRSAVVDGGTLARCLAVGFRVIVARIVALDRTVVTSCGCRRH